METWHKNQITKKKLLRYLLTGGIFVLLFLIFTTPILKMPVSWADFLGLIKTEPSYIPFEYNKSYMAATSCGRNCQTVEYHYTVTKTELVVTATEKVSWYNDPKWDKETKIKGTKYYYQDKNQRQYLYWKEDKQEIELEIEYKGENKLTKSEIVRIANSVKPGR
ncbi:hypothetical protein JOC77_000546 [Peribacillus deserti]|uniref:DUF4367 domain-containing protein n=1 Tax=Peribacillus deserti TaxID=673318 RepID=A0ABS2QDA1_9BACI|nr:hypothetical protein [Peribacillus deserti]MBM7691141.1 hypothetical protein [Peribacillus deserti]